MTRRKPRKENDPNPTGHLSRRQDGKVKEICRNKIKEQCLKHVHAKLEYYESYAVGINLDSLYVSGILAGDCNIY